MDKRKKKLNEQQLIEAHKATLYYAQSMCVCVKRGGGGGEGVRQNCQLCNAYWLRVFKGFLNSNIDRGQSF